MKTETDNSIYLEPGSVWRRGNDVSIIDEIDGGNVMYSERDGWTFIEIDNWLAWAKHPDTVLVYSPSGNKEKPDASTSEDPGSAREGRWLTHDDLMDLVKILVTVATRDWKYDSVSVVVDKVLNIADEVVLQAEERYSCSNRR